MSWGGILERVQFDSIALLCKPQDSSRLDRKYLLAVSSLLDEGMADQIIQTRKDHEICANWLCTNPQNNNVNITLMMSSSNTITKQQQLPAPPVNLGKCDGCCSEKCQATLRILKQRVKNFDPTAPEVAQALFKIFPNAQGNIEQLITKAVATASSPSSDNNNNSGNDEKMTSFSKNLTQSSIIEKNEGKTKNNDGEDDEEKQHSNELMKKMLMATSPFDNSSNNNTLSKNSNNSNYKANLSTSILYTALDPRIAVVVLTDLLLPPSLKWYWTRQLVKQQSSSSVSSWLAPFGAENLITKCIESLETAAPPHERLLSGNTNNNNDNNNISVSTTASLDGAIAKASAAAASAASSSNNNASPPIHRENTQNARARDAAAEIVSSIVIQESRRCALLLRLPCEMPVEYRSKLDKLFYAMRMSLPVPYEDNRDAWFLFVIFLYVVFAITDSDFASIFQQVPEKSILDVLSAFYIEPSTRGKNILSSFFMVD